MSAMRAAYSALVYAALPYALLRLYARGRRERGYRENVGERFGFFGPAEAGDFIWVHAVSVGETRAAEPLIRALGERFPGHRLLLTHMTPTGRATGEELFPDAVRTYLPYDFPGGVQRFLKHFRPRVGLIMETEIWPNVIDACARRGTPLFLVNARLSERSFRRYSRVPGLAREAFGALTGICAQSADDAERLKALGARDVAVTGNLKFDVVPAPEMVARGLEWRAGFGGRRVFLAASTRDGEETHLLDALERMNLPDLLCILVPRHPQRSDEIAALLERRGLRYVRRSTAAAVQRETRVVLGDTMGEMAAYYAACDVAFIGGSLLPFGSQNFIEACAVGRPVLIGPSTYNFAEAADGAVAAGAAARVSDSEDLARTAGALLQDAEARERIAQAALAFSRAHQGATGRVLDFVRAHAEAYCRDAA